MGYRLLEKLVRVVFPPRCIFCSKILSLDADIEICRGCYQKIPFIEGGFLYIDNRHKHACGCDYVVCVCRYTGIVRDSMIKYKFFDKSGYYRAFAKLLAGRIKKMTDYHKFDIILSIPLHKEKENVRGYNQSKLIASLVSRETGVPEKSEWLSRIRRTDSQSLLNKTGRYLNVKGAFEVKCRKEIKGKKILLIDDIMTTGYTLDECGKALREAGAESVVGAVIASGRKY